MLDIGSPLPDVTIRRDDGTEISTRTFGGSPLVLYFYPKDDTPGCTSEAGQFSETYDAFKAKGVEIVGVSRDSPESHRAFKEKYAIPYPLLADVDSTLCDACGIDVRRSTFLFDAGGVLTHVWKRVSVDGHAADVLARIG